MKRKAALVMGLVLIVVLVACRNQESKDTDVTTVYVALDNNIAPFTFTDKNGQPDGLDYRILREIDERLSDYRFVYEMVDYDIAATGLEQGKYDIEAGNKYYTEERNKRFLFSEPYYYVGVTLAVKETSGIKDISDMNGKSLQPLPNSDGLRKIYEDYSRNNPNIKIKSKESSSFIGMSDCLNGLIMNRWDGVIDDYSRISAVVEKDDKLKNQILIIDKPIKVEPSLFILNKKNQKLRQEVNKAIESMRKTGELDELALEYCNIKSIEKYGNEK